MFRGTYTAIVTPFRDGKVDWKAFAALIERQIANKVDGIVPAGTTGEASTLDVEEHLEVIRFTVQQAKGRVQVVAGTGSNNTREAVELTAAASGMGVSGVLVVTPYYNRPTQSGLLTHFHAVADAATVPVVAYNVPGRTGTKINPETVAELAKHPNITAIKEACGSVDQVSEILSQCSITVLSGDDSLTLPMIAVGAMGVISVASNVAPLEVSSMVRCALDGDYAAARKAHLELLPLFKACFVESNPIPAKAFLAELGIIDTEIRLPLEPGQPATVELARKMIKKYRLKP